MLKEFREFAVKGNVVDLAIGVIIGAAFSKIVESMVGDLIMPLLGAVTGGLDFSNYFLGLSSSVTAATLAEARKQGAVLAYGNFLTIALNFLIVAWALFLVVKGINRLKAAQAAEVAKPEDKAPPRQEILLQEIRDLLARK
ncbi:MAG: large conductance mechanosensitive channel protein MscL [Pseudorhodoplanes sp.]